MTTETSPSYTGVVSEVENRRRIQEIPITNLREAIALLSSESQEIFHNLYELVDGRFDNEGNPRNKGRMTIPAPMQERVANLFRGAVESDDLRDVVDAVEGQWTVRIIDRYSKKAAVYNPLRANRPMVRAGTSRFEDDIEARRDNCDLCASEGNTPYDQFSPGMNLEGLTAFPNVSKMGEYNMMMAGPHNPYDLDGRQFANQFYKAMAFGRAVNESDSEAVNLLWGMNFGYKAGASQVHQHSQALLDRGSLQQGEYERFHETAKTYAREFEGREYLRDVLKVHEELGLARHFKDEMAGNGLWVVMPLTPAKERSVLVIGNNTTDHFVSLRMMQVSWGVVEFMMDREEEGVREFNTYFYMPPYGRAREGGYWSDFKPMFYFVDRGSSASPTADMGFMEMQGAVVLSSDPKKVVTKLFNYLERKGFE
ncbi:MAG: hypothetical protein NUV69_05350 [Candidatus Curtissbacteria bacterium]|nr:hypothetical protein [Candidatus Curtissbacteria bacterium]